MPWTLTTPIPGGGLEAGSLGEIKLTNFQHRSDKQRISFGIQYGNTVASKWERGYTPRDKGDDFLITGTDYDDLIANAVPDVQTSDPSDAVRYAAVGAVWVERTYYAAKRGAYEWLETNGHIAAGSVT
jgi:hypothetical protein